MTNTEQVQTLEQWLASEFGDRQRSAPEDLAIAFLQDNDAGETQTAEQWLGVYIDAYVQALVAVRS